VQSTVEPTKDTRLNEFNFGETRQLVFHFDVAAYAEVIERLTRIREYHQLETNTDVFLLLLDDYERQQTEAVENVLALKEEKTL
jgi:hypothetical protein